MTWSMLIAFVSFMRDGHLRVFEFTFILVAILIQATSLHPQKPFNFDSPCQIGYLVLSRQCLTFRPSHFTALAVALALPPPPAPPQGYPTPEVAFDSPYFR